MQLHDDEQFELTVSAVDSKGAATADTFTATSSDENVVTVVDSDADGKTFMVVAGMPGSAVVSIAEADGGPLSFTEAVDVVAGDAALISVVEGTPTKQVPVEPPPVEPQPV